MHTGNVQEGWSAVGKGFYNPEFKFGMSGVALLTLIMANIGTTITPWQIFFQQSAVVDKGMDVKQIKYGKFDTFFGSFMTCAVAAFIIIATAGVFYYNPANPSPATLAADSAANHAAAGPWSKVDPSFHTWRDMDSAAKTAAAMPAVMPPGSRWGQWARLLFAIGLFDAGLLGALCISLATSWALGEVFGWAHSLNRSVREAPWFYVAYALMLMSAGVVSLVADIDVQNIITIFVQVVAVTLLPAALMFLILLLNDKPLMGDYVNTRWQNIANWSIAAFVIVISTAYGISVLFPEWFGAGA
jgi:Mn2+/Fe2+ NRAMP family transporter